MRYATATDSKESHFCKVIMASERGRANKSIIIMPICMRSSSISGQEPQSITQDKVMEGFMLRNLVITFANNDL